MRIQLNKVLVFIALLSFIFASYSSEASNESKGIQEPAKFFKTLENFFSSFSVKGTVENMSPSTVIGLCIAAVILAIVFRGLIFFMIMFGVLVMMFGSTEKVTDCLKDLAKCVTSKSDNSKEQKQSDKSK